MRYTTERVTCDDMIAISDQMTSQHYEEVPFASGKLELEIDWDTLRKIEDVGCLLGIAAFDSKSNLVGYLVVIINPMLHHAGKYIAITDSFYVHPKHRDKGVFQLMLEQAESMCKEVGIVAFHIGVNENFKIPEEMLAKLGYGVTETVYGKEF
jgi:GNAT superfamily N-acetyltransferase